MDPKALRSEIDATSGRAPRGGPDFRAARAEILRDRRPITGRVLLALVAAHAIALALVPSGLAFLLLAALSFPVAVLVAGMIAGQQSAVRRAGAAPRRRLTFAGPAERLPKYRALQSANDVLLWDGERIDRDVVRNVVIACERRTPRQRNDARLHHVFLACRPRTEAADRDAEYRLVRSEPRLFPARRLEEALREFFELPRVACPELVIDLGPGSGKAMVAWIVTICVIVVALSAVILVTVISGAATPIARMTTGAVSLLTDAVTIGLAYWRARADLGRSLEGRFYCLDPADLARVRAASREGSKPARLTTNAPS